ncbi:MAG: GNAT family protein [Salinivirgaceae bacterium]|jgi:diamine N-acetyltransferase|nr:GNAT family protein [Salinivirgaceae bacterium]
METTLLSNDTLHLRAVEPEDANIIFEWENNTENWQVSNTLTPFSHHTIQQYALSASKDIFELKQLRLMIVLNEGNQPIGTIDLFEYDPFHQRAGVGILINSANDRGKGYATQALTILKKYAFDYLHMKQLYCGIGSENTGSLELFEKAGFTICGIKKDWLRTMDGWMDEYSLQCFNK